MLKTAHFLYHASQHKPTHLGASLGTNVWQKHKLAAITGSLVHTVHLLRLTRAEERQQGLRDSSKSIWSGGFVTLTYITSWNNLYLTPICKINCLNIALSSSNQWNGIFYCFFSNWFRGVCVRMCTTQDGRGEWPSSGLTDGSLKVPACDGGRSKTLFHKWDKGGTLYKSPDGRPSPPPSTHTKWHIRIKRKRWEAGRSQGREHLYAGDRDDRQSNSRMMDGPHERGCGRTSFPVRGI